MKLAYLLAQYLYTHKRLDLPGIGTFTLDPSVVIEPENSRHRPATPDGISFENKPSIAASPDLVSYISAQTGKMKALATSDLESHLELAQQFLNIGKPFIFEGIGSLVKIKTGMFEFIPGPVIMERTKEVTEKDVHGVSKKESADAKYQAFLSTPAGKSYWKKPVVTLLILAGIALAIWGGYMIATRNAEEDAGLSETETEATIPVLPDSSQNKIDSSTPVKATTVDSYKYVLEVSNANRAFRRYQQLKETELTEIVRMETADSVRYKLFVTYPITTDTTKTINYLTGFLGKKVYIEYQN